MLQLHRGQLGNDGLIVFATNHPGEKWAEGVAAIPADHVASMFPELAEQLFDRPNFYHTINTFREARGDGNVRYLTTAFADFDCYKTGTEPGRVLELLMAAQDEGSIPPVSMYGRSGAGLWAYWFLRDRDTEAPIFAESDIEAKTEYQNLQSLLQESLRYHLPDVGLDGGSKDISRYCRVGGSLHSNGEIVEYLLAGSPDRPAPRLYTMAELRESLVLPPGPQLPKWEPLPAVLPRATSTGEVPKKAGHRSGRPSMVFSDITQLSRARAGLRKGTRGYGVLVLSWAAILMGKSGEEVSTLAHELGRDWCVPPLEPWRINNQIKSAYKYLNEEWPRRCKAEGRLPNAFASLTNQEIAGWLDVTPPEVRKFGLRQIDPNFVPLRDRRKGRKERERIRREAIHEIVARLEEEKPDRWVVKDVYESLCEMGFTGENGGRMSEKTPWRDLREMGIETPQRRRNRLRREAEGWQGNILKFST